MAPAPVLMLLLAVGLLVAGSFLTASVLRAVWMLVRDLVGWMGGEKCLPARPLEIAARMRTCRNLLCRELNRTGAHFCRRCGTRLDASVRKAELYG